MIPFEIYKLGNNTPVASVSCSLADFHPTVSKAANLLLNKSPIDTVIYVKEKGKSTIQWTGTKRKKRIITDKI